MGKHEAHGGRAAQPELGNDGHEIGTVGTEAVQPDDGINRIFSGFDFDGG